MNPKLSIICASFNQAKFFKKTISALRGQSFKEFEIIIIDNYSTDDTEELTKLLDNVLFIKKKSSPSLAFEEAAKLARGKYLMWATTSDYLYSFDWIETAINFLENNKNYSMVWTSSLNIDEKGEGKSISGLIYFLKPPPSDKRYLGYWLNYHYIPELNYVIKRSVFIRCLTLNTDIDLVHRVLYAFTAFGYQQQYLIGVGHAGRTHDNQLTNINYTRDAKDNFRVIKLKYKLAMQILFCFEKKYILDSESNVVEYYNLMDKICLPLYYIYYKAFSIIARSIILILKKI